MMNVLKTIFALLVLAFMGGCGGSDAFTSSGNSGPATPGATSSGATSVSLNTTKGSIKSDNIDSATITATVLDANNAALSGVTVAFSASGGQLSAANVVTDALGKASVTFSSGSNDPSNRTSTVTATVAGVTPAQIPVGITGSTLAIASDQPSLIIGGTDQANLTITAKDAGNLVIFNSAISLSVVGSGSSPGVATITPSSSTTNVNGQVNAVLKATSPGTVTVTATGLGYSVTQDFAITSAGSAFFISSPDDPATLQIGGTKTITVNAPTQSNVVFVTSLGTFSSCGKALCTVPVVSGTASDVLTSSSGGTATVEVSDAANSGTYDLLTVLISAPSSAAAQIDLQSNVSVVAPSVGGNQSQATLTATVRTSVGNGSALVSGAPVVFTLSNTTGGGESISPAYGVTDSAGKVTATFTSGSRSSDSAGVVVTATLYGTGISPDPSAARNIIINQTAGSVVIGAGTTISEPVTGGALYTLPMSVVVADSNGNPVQTTVTLSAWPAYYRTGYWDCTNSVAVITGTWNNEDSNRNLILDTNLNEDVPYLAGPYPITASNGVGVKISDTGNKDNNGQEEYTLDKPLDAHNTLTFVTDNKLTPANSTAGTLPATVTTNASGVANFTLTYAKEYSAWIMDEIKASVTVLGTETTGVLTFGLPALKSDVTNCQLDDSPFNPIAPAN